MLRTVILVSLLSSLCLGLSGCGMKGDLYMPNVSVQLNR